MEFSTPVGVGPSSSVVIRPVIGIIVSERAVILPVWIVIHYTIRIPWPCIEYMPRAIDITWIEYADAPNTIVEIAPAVIDDPIAADSDDTTIVVVDQDVSCLDDPAEMVIVNGDVLDLDDCPVVVILYVTVVVVPGVKADVHSRRVVTHIYPSSVGPHEDEIELSIREYRELNASFYEDVGLTAVIVPIGCRDRFSGCTHSRS
jgi:hypothetical protein